MTHTILPPEVRPLSGHRSYRRLSPRRRGHRAARRLPLLSTRRARVCFLDERGAATAEYAIATMATVALSSVLIDGSTPLNARTYMRGHIGLNRIGLRSLACTFAV